MHGEVQLAEKIFILRILGIKEKREKKLRVYKECITLMGIHGMAYYNYNRLRVDNVIDHRGECDTPTCTHPRPIKQATRPYSRHTYTYRKTHTVEL